MLRRNSGIFDYGIYQLLFLLAFCMSFYMFLKYLIICCGVFILYIAANSILDRLYYEDIDPRSRGIFITGCDTGKMAFIDHSFFPVVTLQTLVEFRFRPTEFDSVLVNNTSFDIIVDICTRFCCIVIETIE